MPAGGKVPWGLRRALGPGDRGAGFAARGFCFFPSFLFLPFQPCAFSPCSRPSTLQAGRGRRPGCSARPSPSQASPPASSVPTVVPPGQVAGWGQGCLPVPSRLPSPHPGRPPLWTGSFHSSGWPARPRSASAKR